MDKPLINPMAGIGVAPTAAATLAPIAKPSLFNPMVHIPAPHEMSAKERRETFHLVQTPKL